MDARERIDAVVEITARARFESERPGHSWDALLPEVRALWRAYELPGAHALFSATTVECDRCNGFGVVPVATSHFDDQIDEVTSEPCPSCSGSGRIEKGPIAYLAADVQRVGWGAKVEGQWALLTEHDPYAYKRDDVAALWTALFRLPTPSHQSAEAE